MITSSFPRKSTVIALVLSGVGLAASLGGHDSVSAAGITIGVGELQECTISKSMDMTNSPLSQFATNGGSTESESRPLVYLKYELSR